MTTDKAKAAQMAAIAWAQARRVLAEAEKAEQAAYRAYREAAESSDLEAGLGVTREV